MPTMKSSLQFQDETGRHGGRAASGAAEGPQEQPGAVEKPAEGGEDDERKPPARPSGEGSGGGPEVSDNLQEEAKGLGVDEKDLADFRAPDLGTGRVLEARKVPGSLAREMYLQEQGRPKGEVALEYLSAYESLPLNKTAGLRYLQGRIGTDPPEYYLAVFPNEKRLHVLTQLERYNNGRDPESDFAGHIVACVGEISPATGQPDVVVLEATDKEHELFEMCTYNADCLLEKTELDSFADNEDELGNFSQATGTVKGKRAKGQNQGNYLLLPLLLRVPGAVAQLFMDSPNLATAHL